MTISRKKKENSSLWESQILKKNNNYVKEKWKFVSVYTVSPECTKIGQSRRLQKCQTNRDRDSSIDGIIRDLKFLLNFLLLLSGYNNS